jgi:hypothetical protein
VRKAAAGEELRGLVDNLARLGAPGVCEAQAHDRRWPGRTGIRTERKKRRIGRQIRRLSEGAVLLAMDERDRWDALPAPSCRLGQATCAIRDGFAASSRSTVGVGKPSEDRRRDNAAGGVRRLIAADRDLRPPQPRGPGSSSVPFPTPSAFLWEYGVQTLFRRKAAFGSSAPIDLTRILRSFFGPPAHAHGRDTPWVDLPGPTSLEAQTALGKVVHRGRRPHASLRAVISSSSSAHCATGGSQPSPSVL